MNGCSGPPPVIPQVGRSCHRDAPGGPHDDAAPAGGSGRGGVRGTVPAGVVLGWCVGQARIASVSFQVADGRMTFAALAGSGW